MNFAIFGLADFIVTILICVFICVRIIEWRMKKRTPDRMASTDVALLRDMAMTLRSIDDHDALVPLGLPPRTKRELRDQLNRYTHTKETTE